MSDVEKLIYEAKSGLAAFDLYWGDGGPVDAAHGRPWELIRRFLAVFEKAHTPTDDEREDMIAFLLRDHNFEESPWGRTYTDAEIANALRRSEVPEPSAEVLGEWFTSSRGVAVAAVAPMTDRGPSVMVDGRVISPNDVAALIEFKAQGEPSDNERGALGYAIRCAIPNDLNYRPLWKLIGAIQDSVLAADFRRSEMPEPSVECPKCGVKVTDQTAKGTDDV